jgi:hypothetical protein
MLPYFPKTKVLRQLVSLILISLSVLAFLLLEP